MTEQELTRRAKRRLAVLRHAEEITGNVALTCRYYGISRQCFYTWRRRYDAQSLDGLRDRSHRPRVSPNATRTEVVGKIIYLASATSATTATGGASGSGCPATACRSTSSCSPRCPDPAASTTVHRQGQRCRSDAA